MQPEKLFILCRRDLSPSQRAVQCVHAMAGLMLHRINISPALLEWAEYHHTLALLGVEGEKELLQWRQLLNDAGVPSFTFYEEDLNNEATAIAVDPDVDHGFFRNLDLL